MNKHVVPMPSCFSVRKQLFNNYSSAVLMSSFPLIFFHISVKKCILQYFAAYNFFSSFQTMHSTVNEWKLSILCRTQWQASLLNALVIHLMMVCSYVHNKVSIIINWNICRSTAENIIEICVTNLSGNLTS